MSDRSSKLSRVIAAVFLVGLLTMPFSGVLGAASAQDDEQARKSVLRMGFLQMVDSMNPMIGLIDASYVFYGLVYDNTHTINSNMEYVGNIVESTKIVPADDPELVETGRPYGSIWEYEITHNAQWHDGEPFTIDDFVWNINLHAQNYETVWAFQPYAYFMEGARKIDDYTARIYYFNRDTEQPIPCAFGDVLGLPMLPRHKLQGLNVPYISFTWNGVFEGEALPIVGTGPFKAGPDILNEWRSGDRLTLVKNPNHHWKLDRGMEVQFDEIMMMFYDDATSMRIALTSGDLDIAQFPPETYKAIKDGIASGQYHDIYAYDGPKVTQYWTEVEFCMNEGGPNPSRLDPAIRQALATATNKTYIVANYYRGLADEGSTLLPSVNALWHYEPTEAERFDFDLQAAADMLDDAGYRYPSVGAQYRVCTADSKAVKDKLVPLGTELKYEMLVRREYPEEKLIAKYLQETWAQIGVGIDYLVVDESYMGTIVYSYLYDTCIWYWSSDVDPNYMLFCQSTMAWGGWSDNKYDNASYEENYWNSVMALDYDERKQYVDNCQRIHYLDAAFIIMADPYQTYVWRTDTFDGWGDWDLEPGRSLDHFWSANPLFFDLEYIGTKKTGFNLEAALLTGGIIAAVVVAGVALWMLGKKKQKKKLSPLGE